MPNHPQFPHDQDIIYLNHAGVGPWPKCASEAVQAFASECASRGAADYPNWITVETRLRQRLSRIMGVRHEEDIALIPNTSAGLSIIAFGLDWQPGDEVVINDQEFPSNRWVWQALEKRFGVKVKQVCLDSAPTPEDALISALTAKTRILPVSSVQYGSGLRMDLERLGSACHERGIIFCVDAIQSLGALRFASDYASCIVADGHKWMLGPEGLGAMYISPALRERLNLHQFGWHMVEHLGDFKRDNWQPAQSARRFEPGSPNLLGAHALEASLRLIEQTGIDEIERDVLANAQLNFEMAQQRDFELVTPTSTTRHAGIATFRIPDIDPEQLLAELRNGGVACAERCGGIRFSAHFYNTRQDLGQAWQRLDECVDRLRD
ncbi:aminotransferase class V-fold PLP-dependent enzyme [Halorhodospira halochloris]|uniref:aminotransferase class V-fold PLP-dependent enzyme n=1 Tax=Halorhodospira halochloris TaxID=1052 RepID=UPI001EE7E406|nr:aminotransferase class V-fold PLP-dependent enzyme [Halorhodospira halochloris]MCG5549026.1 aminotransferase class V-fold PLP-dependent enzyme [Halorhodospira halochloris]